MSGKIGNWELLIAKFLALFFVSAVGADELRWKFAAGEKWQVTYASQNDSTTLVNGKSTKTAVRTTVTTDWAITEMSTDGAAKITQEIARLQLEVDSPAAGNVKYDSSATAAPATAAEKEIAALMKPLLCGKLTCTMSARGEISDVVPDEALTKALGAAPQGVTQLLEQPLLALPAEIAEGESWLKERSLKLPFGAGTLRQTSTLAGIETHDGVKLAKFTVVGELTVPKDPAAKLALKSHQQTGAIWFDVEAGCFVESETTQQLSTAAPYRDGEIVVKSTNKIRTTLKKL